MTSIALFSFIILIISVVIHEVSHGYMALRLGDLTAKYAGRLTLNPLKHIDPIGSIIVPIITSIAGVSFGWAKPVPFNPDNLKNRRWGEALVAAAGPLSNILLAIIFAMVARLAPFLQNVVSDQFIQSMYLISSLIVLVNITLALFNLIPVPPLDGSKILFALIPERYWQVREWLERYQLLLVVVFIVFLWKYFDPIIYTIFRIFVG